MNKKDEEKIREILRCSICEYNLYDDGCSHCKEKWTALKMARWKDEQLKQFLKDRYNKNLGSIKSWEAESIYKELFNEPISDHPMNF